MKKTFILILVVVFCLAFSACGHSEVQNTTETPSPTTEFDIAGYKNDVSELKKAIMDESILLSNMGQYEYNYWESMNNINETVDFSLVVSNAEEWLYENADIEDGALVKDYESICDKYNNIIKVDVYGTEALEIQEKIINMYNSFDALYLLVTSPSGDILDFADKFNDYSDTIKNNDSILSTILSD